MPPGGGKDDLPYTGLDAGLKELDGVHQVRADVVARIVVGGLRQGGADQVKDHLHAFEGVPDQAVIAEVSLYVLRAIRRPGKAVGTPVVDANLIATF